MGEVELKRDLSYIKEKVKSIEAQVIKTNGCVSEHEKRIQRVEDRFSNEDRINDLSRKKVLLYGAVMQLAFTVAVYLVSKAG